MGFDWLKNKRNRQKQIQEKFLSQKSEIRSEKTTANKFAHNDLGLHVPSHSWESLFLAECVETWFEAAKSNDNGIVEKKASEWNKSLESF